MSRLVTEGFLAEGGHHVIHAGNGEEAVKSIQTHRADLVLMDLRMLGMNGMEATRRIRALLDRG